MNEKFFNMSLDILATASIEGYFLKVNPAFSKIVGYTAQELTSRPILDFLHPDDVEKTSKVIAEQYVGHPVINFENRYKHKYGNYVSISWSGSVDVEEGVIYAIGRDVTHLHQTENRLKRIIESLSEHSIFAVTDTTGIILEANQNFCEISGYSKEELIGKTHSLVNSGKHSKEFWKKVWEKISSGQSWSGIIVNRKKNGEFYTVFSIFTPLVDGAGTIEKYMAIRFDMSNEFKLQRDLTKTLTILEETNTIARVGGWELIVETGELNWTNETFKILDVEKKNGQKPVLAEGIDLFIPEHSKIIEKAVAECIEHGTPYSHEVVALTPKGEKLWVYTNGHAHYKDDKVIRLSGTIQDINAKKLAELSLKEEQRKSIHSAKLATLGELSASIAHEINNPLTLVLANLDFLKIYANNPEKFEKCLTTIEKSCHRIYTITKSLVKQARKTSENDFKPIKVASIVQESIDLTKLKGKQFDVDISLECNSNGEIFCNEVEVEQVMINLINNSIDAIKNLDERWIKLNINEMNDLISIRVTDSGKGIADDVAVKLFEPFYTTKESGEGTGLGLSLSKEILDKHNSSIYIDQNSQYTSFVITIPKFI